MGRGLLVVGWLAMLFSATVARAQAPVVSPADEFEQRTVAGLLASTEPAKQAWGAVLAANYEQRKFVPEIRRLLTSWHPDVRMQALDALIRLETTVPTEELLPLWDQHRTSVFILLVRSDEGRDALRLQSREERLRDAEWTALNNLLVAAKASGIAAELMETLEITMYVNVIDTAGIGAGEGGSFGGGVFGSEGAGIRPGFPPLHFYWLDDDAAPGDRLFAPGLHPIYLRRSVRRFEGRVAINRNVYRQEYLAQLLGMDSRELPLQPHNSRSVVWRGAETYLAEIAALRAELESGFRILAHLLHERGLATPYETDGLKPRILLEIHDQRQNREPALPSVLGNVGVAP